MIRFIGTLFGLLLVSACATNEHMVERQPPEISSLDNGALPSVVIQPRYPRKAAVNGIEGWVKFDFELDQDGHPINVVVLDSHPEDVFVYDAQRALKKWTFKTSNTANDKARYQYTMEFKLAI